MYIIYESVLHVLYHSSRKTVGQVNILWDRSKYYTGQNIIWHQYSSLGIFIEV